MPASVAEKNQSVDNSGGDVKGGGDSRQDLFALRP